MTQALTEEQINDWANTPIRFDYAPLENSEIDRLIAQANCVQFKSSPRLRCDNAYFQRGLAGTLPGIYARESVVMRVNKLIKLLPESIGIYIFDAFRSIDCQVELYEEFKQIVRSENSKWDDERIEKRTLEFVSHPFDKSRFAIPLHNSGGAIDLGLFNTKDGCSWDFGTDIDAITDLSYTDYFEQDYQTINGFDESRWLLVRRNRRILYHVMHDLGFTNFPNEWWHYDLGDCLWAKIYAREHIYESMETSVMTAIAK